MTVLKISGAVLVLMSCFFWSADKKAGLREHLDALDACVRFINYVRREIDCFSTLFPDILSGFSDKVFDKYSFTALAADDPRAAAEKLPLKEEEKEDMITFLSSVGRGFAEGELKLCDFYAEKFNAAAGAAREEYPRRTKVQSSLAFLVGACAVILLI